MHKFLNNNIYKTMILLSIIFMDLLTGMEFDLFVPSFSELQRTFHLSAFSVEALLSINFVGYCFSLFIVGELADQFGRKPIIILGLIIFIMGSLLCLIPYYQIILVGRLLQGLGVAAPSILSFLIIADLYPLNKQQFYSAMLNGVMNTAAGIAPIIGSYITLYFHWHGNFITLLLLAIVTLAMTLVFIPSYQLHKKSESLEIGSYKLIFKSKTLMLMMVDTILRYVPYWIFVGMSSLLYVVSLKVSLSYFGFYQGVLAIIFAIGSVLFGFIINKFNHKKMLIIANGIFIFSIISLGLVLNRMNPLLITIAFIPFIIGQIAPSHLLFPICINLIPQAKARVCAIMQGGRLIVSALALQIAGWFYQGNFKNIGLIMIVVISSSVITLFYVIRNRHLQKYYQS